MIKEKRDMIFHKRIEEATKAVAIGISTKEFVEACYRLCQMFPTVREAFKRIIPDAQDLVL